MFSLWSEPIRSDEGDFAVPNNGENNYQSAGRSVDELSTGRGHNIRAMTTDKLEQDPVVEISAGQKMLSAVSGSLLTSLLVTPLDVVRVRLQSQPRPSAPSTRSSFSNLPPNLGVTACCREVFWVTNNADFCIAGPTSSAFSSSPSPASPAACAIEVTSNKTFTSTLDGLRKIARNEGLSSLWRGLSPTLAMAVPANVIYFTGYDLLRTHHTSPIRTYIPDAYAPLIAGSVARVAAAAVISPIEMFRTRLQATEGVVGGAGVFRETLAGLKDMVRAQGYTSLWKGLTLTMWRDVPFSGIYWWGYEVIRDALTRRRDHGRILEQMDLDKAKPQGHSRSRENHTNTFVDSFVAGAVSGAVAAVVTTPFDVGKTRQQVLKQEKNAATGAMGNRFLRPEERSMPQFLYHILREEGAGGLFRGGAARCLKVAPACAIMISSYEIGKKMARNVNERRVGRLET